MHKIGILDPISDASIQQEEYISKILSPPDKLSDETIKRFEFLGNNIIESQSSNTWQIG